MNKLIISLVFCTSFAAHADRSEIIYRLCNNMSETARHMMVLRQDGASIVELMKGMETDVGRELVEAAYKKPYFQTEKFKKHAIEKFATDHYLSCLKTYKVNQ